MQWVQKRNFSDEFFAKNIRADKRLSGAQQDLLEDL